MLSPCAKIKWVIKHIFSNSRVTPTKVGFTAGEGLRRPQRQGPQRVQPQPQPPHPHHPNSPTHKWSGGTSEPAKPWNRRDSAILTARAPRRPPPTPIHNTALTQPTISTILTPNPPPSPRIGLRLSPKHQVRILGPSTDVTDATFRQS